MRKSLILPFAAMLILSANASLPLHEPFDTFTGWTVSDGGSAEIQTNVAVGVEGRALQINSGTVSRYVPSESESIWISFYAQIKDAPQDDPNVSNSNTSVAFYINTNRNLVVYNGDSTQLVENLTMATNEWARFNIYCDYRANQWMLSVITITDDGTQTNTTSWMDFYSRGSRVESLLIANNGTSPVYFDELRVEDTEPADSIVAQIDTSKNGIPDWWEKHYFGNTGVTNVLDKARNGIMTLSEAYIAGIDPDDPNDVLRVSKADSNGRRLGWNGKPGRVYDVYYAESLTSGFGESPVETFTGGDYIEFEEDENEPRLQNPSGFYKIRVRKP